jgi:hypothetical protein
MRSERDPYKYHQRATPTTTPKGVWVMVKNAASKSVQVIKNWKNALGWSSRQSRPPVGTSRQAQPTHGGSIQRTVRPVAVRQDLTPYSGSCRRGTLCSQQVGKFSAHTRRSGTCQKHASQRGVGVGEAVPAVVMKGLLPRASSRCWTQRIH